jgi:hypothetical protein
MGNRQAMNDAQCLVAAVAAPNNPARATVWTGEGFSVWRVRSLEWHDAKPEWICVADSMAEAIAEGVNNIQAKSCFFVLHTDEKRGRTIRRFYRVKSTAKSGFYRSAYDGGSPVRVNGRDAEHLFDLAELKGEWPDV